MKRIALSLTVISLFLFTSCKDNKKTFENPEAASVAAISKEVPVFSDPDVQKYVEEYDAYVKELVAAAADKDLVKLTFLSQKSQEWTERSVEINQKLASNPEDMKKFHDYVGRLSQEVSKAMSAQ
ncbi:MAG: hypothetical protein LBP34_02025 [Flavobacteriaceae bacterium]|jgi:hypothetical protein|nr:hypothetical protein [Flavobacteriaceae bacterium]